MAKTDLHYQLLDPSIQRGGSNFRFSFVPPVAGTFAIQKLANRWLKRFVTRKNSNPSNLAEGTDFALLLGGNVDEIADLQASILLYLDDASDQIKEIDRRSASLSDDERLRSVNLLLFQQVGPSDIEFWVEVVSISGKRAQLLIPYATG